MMTGKEIVKRTVSFTYPERIACSFPSPYPNDFYYARMELPKSTGNDWEKVDAVRWERIDEWGNRWARLDDSSKGEVVKGALDNLNNIETIPLPDIGCYAYYKRVEECFSSGESNGKYTIGWLPGFAFNITRKMRRLEQYLEDIVLYPDRIKVLLRRIDDLLEKAIQCYARTGVDAIMFPEDWGSQQSLFISPGMWREIFKPGFIRLCTVAHSLGLKAFMHSCGLIIRIIPDLIECGIDVLQFDQPRLHGIDALAEFSGKVTFWCPVDIQTTLQTKNPDNIGMEAKELIEKLGNKGGGLIAGYYIDNESIGLDPKWQDIACKAFLRYSCYSQKGGGYEIL